MKSVFIYALAASSFCFHSTLNANKLAEFSVFQPVDGVSANVYISQNNIVIHPSGNKAPKFIQVDPHYLDKYSDLVYKIKDMDQDGSIDVAKLDSVNLSSTRFCYQVYSFDKSDGNFSSRPISTECELRAAPVIESQWSTASIEGE